MNADDTRRSIDDTSRELLIGEPYFGHLFVGLVRASVGGEFVTRLVAAGHTPRIEVGIAKWSALGTALKRQTALKHELLHLTFKHPLRARDFALLDLYGLAADLVVNQLLDARELEDAFTLDQFAELRLERDQTVDYYYAALAPLYEACCRGGGGQGGECAGGGGGDGSRQPDDGDGDESRGSTSTAEEAMKRWLEGKSAACSGHSSWGDFKNLPSARLSVLETNTDALIETTVRRARSRKWGRLPSHLIEFLQALVDKKSEVPWRRILRLFGATSERTYLKNTVSRPSKRFGTTPGIRVRRKRDVVVAVDTSGSVPASDLALFFSEIHAMWRRGAQVTILECDAAVQREYPYRGTPPKGAAGRGGTAFDPAIERANHIHPDALIYFTDGYAPEPQVRARMPVLWVLSTEGCNLDEAGHLPGRRVKLTRRLR